MTLVNNVAESYGDALFMLSEELSETEDIRGDLEIVSEVISENPKYLDLIDTPALPIAERLSLVDKAFGGLNKNLVNLIKILAEKRLTYSIKKVSEHFMKKYDDANGIERVEAVTVVPMTDAQISKLEAKLKDITGKKQIVVKNTVDPALLGGMKLRYSGIQLDGSVRTKLDSFEKSIGALVI